MSSINRNRLAAAPPPLLADDTASTAALQRQAACRIALAKAHDDWQVCLNFGSFLNDFQLGMLHRAPWTAEQYDGIERAELIVSKTMVEVLDRISALQEVQ